MKRNYKRVELTVYWDSDLCIHCGNCVKGLPQVFDTTKRPWVNVQGASAQEIKDQVLQCPSGALTISEPNVPN